MSPLELIVELSDCLLKPAHMSDPAPNFIKAVVAKLPGAGIAPEFEKLYPRYDCILVTDSGDEYHTILASASADHEPDVKTLIRFFKSHPEEFEKLSAPE